jgi:hypothetical protein
VHDVSTIVLTPTLSDPLATYVIAPGSGTNDLLVGPNRITVTVTSQEGTQQTCVVVVTRAPSSDATLLGLGADASLTPAFVSGTRMYSASVPNLPSTIVFYTITSSAGACVAGECPLGSCAGLVTMTVDVQAPDGSIASYAIVVEHVPPVSLLGSGFDGATAVLIDGSALVSFTVLSDGRIDFIMPSGVEGAQVDIEVIGPGGSSVAARAFTYVGANVGEVSGGSGGVVTSSIGATLTVPSQGVIGRFIFTMTSEPPPIDPLGNLLMHSFQLQAAQDGIPLPSITNLVTIEPYVDPAVALGSETPYLYEYVGPATRCVGVAVNPSAVSEVGCWFLVPNQTCDPASRSVRAPLKRMSRYALSTLILFRMYLPFHIPGAWSDVKSYKSR